MSAPARHRATETTQPIARYGMPAVTYREGDRVACPFDTLGGRRKVFVGTVTHTDSLTLEVCWDNHPGVGRFAHGHEPDQMRHATFTDERVLASEPNRRLAAAHLRDMAREQRTWPAEVRTTLLARAARLDGGGTR